MRWSWRRGEEAVQAGGSSFLTAEGDDGSPAGQCETPRVDPTQLARSQDGSGDHLTHISASITARVSLETRILKPEKRPQRWETCAEQRAAAGGQQTGRWVSCCGACCCVVFVFSYEVSFCSNPPFWLCFPSMCGV